MWGLQKRLKSMAQQFAKKPILSKPLFYHSCYLMHPETMSFVTNPFLGLLRLFTDVFNTRQHKEHFLILTPKVTKDNTWF